MTEVRRTVGRLNATKNRYRMTPGVRHSGIVNCLIYLFITADIDVNNVAQVMRDVNAAALETELCVLRTSKANGPIAQFKSFHA